jgi:hypothetical protein
VPLVLGWAQCRPAGIGRQIAEPKARVKRAGQHRIQPDGRASGCWVRDVKFGAQAVVVRVCLRRKRPLCSGRRSQVPDLGGQRRDGRDRVGHREPQRRNAASTSRRARGDRVRPEQLEAGLFWRRTVFRVHRVSRLASPGRPLRPRPTRRTWRRFAPPPGRASLLPDRPGGRRPPLPGSPDWRIARPVLCGGSGTRGECQLARSTLPTAPPTTTTIDHSASRCAATGASVR